jgi:hypothetical protein
MIGFYDLPLDYLDRFTERVASVTAEQIRDAYLRRVHPDRLAVVMVGGGSSGDDAEHGMAAMRGAVPARTKADAPAAAIPAGGEG